MDVKIPVGVLGATGSVGQRFIQLLADHPLFEITAVCASERSSGKSYGQSVHWFQSSPIPAAVRDMEIRPCHPSLPCRVMFSGLDARVAGTIETQFQQAGYAVVSNAKNHRMDPDVPLLIPEVNPDHLGLLAAQRKDEGLIVTNPNCSAIGVVMALKPLWDSFGLEAVHIVTLQALSGAGYPGVASLDILDNVLPIGAGEVEKLQTEPLKLLGTLHHGAIRPASLKIAAMCNRVPVSDGHLACVSLKLAQPAPAKALRQAWQSFSAEPQALGLPSAPRRPLHYLNAADAPQPRRHRDLERGMAVSIGGLRPCPLFDYQFRVLSHNTLRGAAGCAILNAELMHAKGLI